MEGNGNFQREETAAISDLLKSRNNKHKSPGTFQP